MLLSAELKAWLRLTLSQLENELCRNTNPEVTSRPLQNFTRNDETKPAQVQKVKTIAPVRIAINVDGVYMKFDASVVLEGHFQLGLYSWAGKSCAAITSGYRMHKERQCKSIASVGIAENNVKFQLGGDTLKTHFFVIADQFGLEGFAWVAISCVHTTCRWTWPP